MTTPPNQRDWENFFSAGHFQCFVDAVGDDGGFIGFDRSTAESVAELANALIRQAIADAVTVYGQEIALFPSENSIITVRMMSWLPEKDYFAREKRDTHSAKLIAIKQIGT